MKFFFGNKIFKIHPLKYKYKEHSQDKHEELYQDEEEEEEECSICLENLNHKNIIYLSKCKHKFHISCIKEWFKNMDLPECPLCRSEQNRLNKRLNNI